MAHQMTISCKVKKAWWVHPFLSIASVSSRVTGYPTEKAAWEIVRKGITITTSIDKPGGGSKV